MIRKMIHIDRDKCNGCGACTNACLEGAIALVDGKAQLLRDDYCDGLGACLPHCPVDAISMIEREAEPFNEEAVKRHLASAQEQEKPSICACPGAAFRTLDPVAEQANTSVQSSYRSQLRQWPVQIKLASINAPYFDQAHLLIAADCSAYAYANFHGEFIKNHVVLIGCPKLDNVDYSEKLTQIIRSNAIRSIKVVRMEVPCCSGLTNAVKTALIQSGKMIPWQVVTISCNGEIVEE